MRQAARRRCHSAPRPCRRPTWSRRGLAACTARSWSTPACNHRLTPSPDAPSIFGPLRSRLPEPLSARTPQPGLCTVGVARAILQTSSVRSVLQSLPTPTLPAHLEPPGRVAVGVARCVQADKPRPGRVGPLSEQALAATQYHSLCPAQHSRSPNDAAQRTLRASANFSSLRNICARKA